MTTAVSTVTAAVVFSATCSRYHEGDDLRSMNVDGRDTTFSHDTLPIREATCEQRSRDRG